MFYQLFGYPFAQLKWQIKENTNILRTVALEEGIIFITLDSEHTPSLLWAVEVSGRREDTRFKVIQCIILGKIVWTKKQPHSRDL